jgi:acetoin utilization deacetylase AcuC-like enzyme
MNHPATRRDLPILIEVSDAEEYTTVKIFYRPEQTVEANQSFSPSPGKPAQVVAAWQKAFPIEVCSFDPLSRDDIALAHHRDHVDGVLDLKRANGFGNRSPEVAASLTYTTGSFFAAARHAFIERETCVSPTSGFHHAGYADGGAFCTFNGLVIAAQKLRSLGCTSVGILDLDYHYGNGTDDIITRLGLNDYIKHYTFGGRRERDDSPEDWLANRLPDVLHQFHACEVVLYQAGADMHVDDPLGGFLTTDQLFTRDLTVFRAMKELGVPVAWNLAGGYQSPLRKVLTIHHNTARALMLVHQQKGTDDAS